MVWNVYPRDLMAELERLQRGYPQSLDHNASIRGSGRSRYPALNVGGTPESVEIYAFAPGLDPARIELLLDRGVLTIAGERPDDLPRDDARTAVHIGERFAGRFRRVVNLPEDADPESVAASYRDGVLHISVQRRVASAPRRINVT
ncbi:MAG: Hsp20/alpha crystallin family protein [Rhodocyclaceae bacterium]|nr:Hsp20/alpha crystallin family protein [Rhodocyclaceae bacterium]